jgi:hypothetical protein
MSEHSGELLPIDLQLRFAPFGLECGLGVSFSGSECARVFSDAAEDQVSAKQYVFYESPRLVVTGRVDEYEPESVWLNVRGRRGSSDLLRAIAEGAKSHALRLRRAEDSAT